MKIDPIRELESRKTQIYALLRIVTGAMFAFHGAEKLFGIMDSTQPAVLSQMWIGGAIEFFGGLAVSLGIKTRWAAFLCSGEMAVAYLQFHWRFAFDAGFWPTVNKGELALLYSFVFLLIASQGPGRWTV